MEFPETATEFFLIFSMVIVTFFFSYFLRHTYFLPRVSHERFLQHHGPDFQGFLRFPKIMTMFFRLPFPDFLLGIPALCLFFSVTFPKPLFRFRNFLSSQLKPLLLCFPLLSCMKDSRRFFIEIPNPPTSENFFRKKILRVAPMHPPSCYPLQTPRLS